MDYIVGVDEVGRGPLAGPVAVCAALAPARFDFSVFPKLDDSKKLTEKRREEIFNAALALQREGVLRFAVQFGAPHTIDEAGIEHAVSSALKGAIANVKAAPSAVRVFLDGRLHAPEIYSQETIVGGDGKVPIISLASVIAKVFRDRTMVDLAPHFPEYGFEQHKGYGTAAHIAAIKKHGPSALHRKTFLSRIAPDA